MTSILLTNFIFSLVINSWFLVILCYLQGVICRGLGGSDPPFCTARPSHFSVRKISGSQRSTLPLPSIGLS